MLKLNRMTSGDTVIVASSVVMTFGENPLDLYLVDKERSLQCHVRFSFVADRNVKEPLVRTRGIDEDHGIDIVLINFEHSFGRGIANPMEIAHRQGGETLFLSFIVNTYTGTTAKQIMYTVFSREVGAQNVAH